ncbi:acyltransferase family protein [Chitinilyticum aquatile]|uniref:acyltransferase family protein n=1 Tax=Chitinilyticum aquatile TaxID=362520 RepID=UPI00041C41CB|nr:acyltransferase [Chitinilyticum aquatile]
MSLPASRRFTVLDSFRGLAALCVVVFHLHLLQGFSQWDFFRSAGLWVEFFFVLSGFVLCHSYGQRRFDAGALRDYLISRCFRILPLHVVMLLVFTLGEVLLLLANSAGWTRAIAFSGSTDASQWLPNLLLLQAWLPWTNPFSFNGPAWSISVEFYLYLLFGIILLGTAGRLRLRAYLLIAIGCTACVLTGQPFTGSGAFRGLTCFFMGALAYEAFRHLRWPAWQSAVYSALEVLALGALYVALTAQYPHKSYFACCFFSAFIVLFAREGGAISRLLRQKPFEQLGHWSFSIYLIHFALLHAVQKVLQHVASLGGPRWLAWGSEGAVRIEFISTGSIAGDTLFGLAMLALTLLLASRTYRHIELPGIAAGKMLRAPRAAMPGDKRRLALAEN